MVGLEYIVHDVQLIVYNHQILNYAVMVFAFIQTMQMVIDAFVIKDGLIMVQRQLVIMMLMNVHRPFHIVQLIRQLCALIYPVLIDAAHVHMVIKTKRISSSNKK